MKTNFHRTVALKNKEEGVRYIYWVRDKAQLLVSLLELSFARGFAEQDMREEYDYILPYT